LRLFARRLPPRIVDSLRAVSSSISEVTRRSSFRALFPAAESCSRTRSLLPFQRSFSERLPGDDLAFELLRCGASPFGGRARGGPVQDRKRRGSPFPLQTACFSYRQVARRKRPDRSCRAVFLQKVPAMSGSSRKAVEGQDRCSLRKPSIACQHLVRSGIAL
jgi:hypothetical protein